MAPKNSGVKVRSPQRYPRTPWFWLIPVCTLLPYILSKLHYQLPAPLPPNDATGRAQPSEEIVLSHIQALEDIGYRTVGTEEAVKGEEYVIAEVNKIAKRCKDNAVLNCEVWVQKGSGYHRFSIMDHDVLKLYSGITNVILKVSAHQPPSGKSGDRKDSVLLGSHIDSTLPSPGAADDGMGVGVMLDIARVLVDRNEPFDNSVIFMWNGGEETLQDGSHLYSTQHPSAQTVRAIINLEAAGSTGGALLFQATSKEMIEAFKHSPHPRGTVIAADVFSSGIILSDTDFGQFEQYLGVSGLDMAIVGHSYFYHTRKDVIEHIEKGSSQHFSSNIMAIVDHLLSPESPLGNDEPWSPPDVVYMSLYDRIFLHWTMASADVAYVAIATVIGTLSLANFRRDRGRAFAIALIGAPVGLIAGIISALALAAFMTAIGRNLSWFSHEGLCVALYFPMALLGSLSTQYALESLVPAVQLDYLEQAHYYAQLGTLTAYMLLAQAVRIRSAYLFAGLSCVLLVGAITAEVSKLLGRRAAGLPFFTAYIIPLSLLVTLAMEAFTTTLDIFVPLTGRMGKEAPAEFIIAVITSVCGLTFVPLAAPLFHRASRTGQRKVLGALVITVLAVIVLFSGPWWSPYDFMHPKRIGVQFTHNHTSGMNTAHLAFMDVSGNPSSADLAVEFHEQFGNGAEMTHTVLTDDDSDWDTLYPVSTFLDTYRWDLPATDFKWPAMEYSVTRNERPDGTHIHLKMNHEGLVWPAFAFTADLIDWSFDFEPPHGMKRHHIKAATSIDEHILELQLVVRLKDDERLNIHWSAIDLNQMVPGTASRRGPDMPASKWLMDMDAWALEKYKGSLDILMSGVVVGVIEV